MLKYRVFYFGGSATLSNVKLAKKSNQGALSSMNNIKNDTENQSLCASSTLHHYERTLLILWYLIIWLSESLDTTKTASHA